MSPRTAFWPRFVGWVLSVPLRVKIMGIVLGVVLLLAVVVTSQVRATMRAMMREELRRRGVSVAHDVAARATDLILTDNIFAAHKLVRDRLASDRDVRYILIVDRAQELIVHTFGQTFPAELLQANAVVPGEEVRLALLETEEGLIWDAAVPILDGKLGSIRVGMSEGHVQTVIRGTTRFLLLMTGCVSLVSVAAAYLLTFVATRPILNLVKMTEAVGAGQLQRKVPVRTRDEVGRLATAFNAMTEDLARSRSEIEQFNRQLLRRNEELQRKEASRRRLLDKLIDAQEEERKRVARELHDQVGQSLTALIMGLGSTEEMIPLEAGQMKSQLVEFRELAADILVEIRRLMMNLRPSLLDDLGLIPAVRSYAETHLARAKVRPHVEVAGVKRRLSASVDIALFRVVQEAVTNIVKHAEAREATIELRFGESSIAAIIEDDGKGFDRVEPQPDANALGLLGMRERITLLGGTWRIESQRGRGTRIAVEIPTPL